MLFVSAAPWSCLRACSELACAPVFICGSAPVQPQSALVLSLSLLCRSLTAPVCARGVTCHHAGRCRLRKRDRYPFGRAGAKCHQVALTPRRTLTSRLFAISPSPSCLSPSFSRAPPAPDRSLLRRTLSVPFCSFAPQRPAPGKPLLELGQRPPLHPILITDSDSSPRCSSITLQSSSAHSPASILRASSCLHSRPSQQHLRPQCECPFPDIPVLPSAASSHRLPRFARCPLSARYIIHARLLWRALITN